MDFVQFFCEERSADQILSTSLLNNAQLGDNLTSVAESAVPYVAECVQHSTLILIPCLFLLIFFPVVLYALNKSDNGPIEGCSPITFRIITCGILQCVVGFNAIRSFSEQTPDDSLSPHIHLFFQVLLCITLTLALVLMIACRNRGVISSGVLFNFWLLLAVCGLPEFHYKIAMLTRYGGQDPNSSMLEYLLSFIYYPLVVFVFVLSCFADIPKYRITDKRKCPEDKVSFLSQITFSWFNQIAILGHNRPLQMEDLWELPNRDKSKHLVAKFDRVWATHIAKYKSSSLASQTKPNKVTLPINGAQETQALYISTQNGAKSTTEPPSILWPLFQIFKWPLISGAFYKLIFDLLQFVSPQLLRYLINFIEDKSQPMWVGISISLTMFAVALLQSMILHQYFHQMFRLGMNIRSCLTSAVYKKALNLSNTARKNRTIGEIVNLMSIDTQRLQDITTFIMLFWSSPLQVLLAIYFLYRLLGVAVIAGLVILLLLIPFNTWISTKMRTCQVEQMKYKDERLKIMSEMLNGIKVLKLYAWEESMQKTVLDIRAKEKKVLRKLTCLNTITALSWSCAPFLVAVLTFGLYVNIDPQNNILTPQITFVGLALFNILRFPLAVFAMIFSQAIQTIVSNKRLKQFLAEEELDPRPSGDAGPPEAAISVHNASFTWEREGDLALKDLTFAIPQGSLVAIVGRIGSGKSSLLSAILGEMHRQSGAVNMRGRVAYVPQQAWIQNLTLKDNVLFGQKCNEKLYSKVLDSCALTIDLDSLPAGDQTEIGEKGINLSGGQKQRVSLARAVYSESDVYLLDDPLAAVDAHVGKQIFENVIGPNGMLAKKTRVFVTHGLPFLKYCDQVIVIKDGRISESGSYEQLLCGSGEFSEILEEFLVEETKNRARSVSFGESVEEVQEVLAELERFDPEKRRYLERQLSKVSESIAAQQRSISPEGEIPSRPTSPLNRANSVQPGTPVRVTPLPPVLATSVNSLAGSTAKSNGLGSPLPPPKPSRIIEKEEMETGQVKLSVYLSYLRAIGYVICSVFLGIYIFSSILGVCSNLWLADWSDHAKEIQTNSSSGWETQKRLAIYTALGLGQAIFVALASIIMALGMVQAGCILHEGMLKNLLRSPMSFFDVTPLGRILNRFGKDVDFVDTRLPGTVLNFIGCLVMSIATLAVPIIVTPQVALPMFGILLVYFYLMRFYVSTSRQLKRLESTTRSPIYSHFQESVQGASLIRAYQSADRFLVESQNRVDHNLVAFFPSLISNRWLAVRLELVGNVIVLSSAMFAAVFRDSSGVTAGLVGLSVSYALSVTQTLNWAVRMTSELEANIVSVERISEYTAIPTEASLETGPEVVLSEVWPTRGEVILENVELRYRPDLDLVLKGVTAHIKPREKVGIIGRTGAGKSSLTLALFRLVEPAGGKIIIDDLDIAKLGLKDLRSRLTIVPQDPVLFSGTLRTNLDPFNTYDTPDIWRVLQLTSMDTFVSTLPEKLEHKISEGGENLSVGQRQLICLARALLRKSKVLMLDEAAASVDMETDQLIQKTIREQFSDCTVLTIAHRLHSVMDCDRLMVFDQGRIVEFDTPQALLAKPNSVFRSLAIDAGIEINGAKE
ncbi:ABC transporter transmembrane region domain-containing protein [Ditylenchus destructor]|uniref:ABC-type glutathione-S-conjugate transporter n=1 Tax=Ditylenchus destructor TaxID=166010 RepID=A0AAD4MQ35_9BILA|nr:ABC transporter transmembrane region domain-containing protein [Ditylenchus destructor]